MDQRPRQTLVKEDREDIRNARALADALRTDGFKFFMALIDKKIEEDVIVAEMPLHEHMAAMGLPSIEAAVISQEAIKGALKRSRWLRGTPQRMIEAAKELLASASPETPEEE